MMETWAASNEFCNLSILFLCVNVDEPVHHAKAFSLGFINQLQLHHCTVGYIESPINFGQLGCSGFIVTDPTGKIILPRSPAYLQYREQAFGWMQSFMLSLPIHTNTNNNNNTPSIQCVSATVSTKKKTDTNEQEEKSMNDNSDSLEELTGPECTKYLNELCTSVQKTSIDSMDDDHTECFQLLVKIHSSNIVQKVQAIQLLEDYYQHLLDHFEQEELLMDKCSFGGGRNGMGYKGHAADHNNILTIISSYIDTIRQMKNTTTNNLSSESNNQKKWINDKFIMQLATSLHQHIANYDSLYTKDFHAAEFK